MDAYSFSKENCCNSYFDDEVLFEQESNLKEIEKGISPSYVNNMNNSTPTPCDYSGTSENIKKDQRSKIFSRAHTVVGEKNVDYEKFNLYKNLEIFNDSTAGKTLNLKATEDFRTNKILMVENAHKMPETIYKNKYQNNFNTNSDQYKQGYFGPSQSSYEIKNPCLGATSPNMAPNFMNFYNLYQNFLSNNIFSTYFRSYVF